MWQEKQDNIILPGQLPCTSRSRHGPHGENMILPPPPGNHNGSSRKRKSTAIDSPGPTSEYHFPWDSSPRDASSRLGLSGQGNNTIVYLNQANSAEPVNLRPQFDQNNRGVYSNHANFRHQFDNGHHHYSYNSSETWPTRNTDFNGTGIATMTNASYNLPPQPRGFRPLVEIPVGQPFTVPNQQSQAGYVFGQTEAHINFPFSSNSGTEKAQVGPNLHDLVNFSNKNSTMCNTWVDFARPVEIFQQNFVQPNRFCEGLNGITGPKEDNKSETSCASTQSGQCLNNAGIVNLPSVGTVSVGASICTKQDETNRLLTKEEQNHILGDIKVKETTVLASDMENLETKRVWEASKSGEFTCKSFLEIVSHSPSLQQLPQYDFVWKNGIPHKVKIFAWLTVLGKVNTCDKVQARRPYLALSPAWCIMCKKDSESIDHLLLHCEVARHMWDRIRSSFGIAGPLPRKWAICVLIEWCLGGKNKGMKTVWRLFVIATAWHLWLERNKRVFEETNSSMEEIWGSIVFSVGLWARAFNFFDCMDSFLFRLDPNSFLGQ